MTLTSSASAFKIPVKLSESSQETEYSHDQAYLLQQKAVERVLGWIVKNAEKDCTLPRAKSQFEEACMCMNKFGIKEKNFSQAYCENRLQMDNFMAEAVMRIQDRSSDDVRYRYKSHVKTLGERLDGYCSRVQFHGRNYLPGGKATYIGPDNIFN
jgi:hypothetical protein